MGVCTLHRGQRRRRWKPPPSDPADLFSTSFDPFSFPSFSSLYSFHVFYSYHSIPSLIFARLGPLRLVGKNQPSFYTLYEFQTPQTLTMASPRAYFPNFCPHTRKDKDKSFGHNEERKKKEQLELTAQFAMQRRSVPPSPTCSASSTPCFLPA